MAMDIGMTIAGETYRVTLLGNDAAKDLAGRLPLEVVFEDYGSTERISYLDRRLVIGNAPVRTEPARGDLAYYAPWGNLAAFVKPFRMSEGLVPLGRMDEDAIEALRQSGGERVRLERLP